jgi:hypothetical protein
VALLWEGNQYHGFSMFEPTPPFDFVLAEAAELPVDERACLVPELAVRARLERSLSGLHHVLDTLTKRGGRTPVLVGTPPPIGDDATLRELLVRDFFFKQLGTTLGIDIASAPLSAPLLRYKLWRLVQRMTRLVGEQYGVPFHPVPRAAQNDQGFLRADLWADTSHGNTAYGQLVLDDLQNAMQTYQAS